MKVILACLADYASQDQMGKLQINGVFDTLMASKVPVMHPQMFLVVRVRLSFEDNRKPHKLHIKLIDPDGKNPANLEVELAHEPIKAGEHLVLNQMIGISGMQFGTYGRFTWLLLSDNEPPVEVYLDVRRPPVPPRP